MNGKVNMQVSVQRFTTLFDACGICDFTIRLSSQHFYISIKNFYMHWKRSEIYRTASRREKAPWVSFDLRAGSSGEPGAPVLEVIQFLANSLRFTLVLLSLGFSGHTTFRVLRSLRNARVRQ